MTTHHPSRRLSSPVEFVTALVAVIVCATAVVTLRSENAHLRSEMRGLSMRVDRLTVDLLPDDRPSASAQITTPRVERHALHQSAHTGLMENLQEVQSVRSLLTVSASGDALDHMASSGGTNLDVSSDEGITMKIGGSVVGTWSSTGLVVAGSIISVGSARTYAYGAGFVGGNPQNIITSIKSVEFGSVVTNGGIAYDTSSGYITPTTTGLYRITFSAIFTALFAADKQSEAIAALYGPGASSIAAVAFTKNMLDYHTSLTYNTMSVGPLVVSLTGGSIYRFGFRTVSGGGQLFVDTAGSTPSFMIEAFPFA
mmetsp:Transcript_37935/g.60832  ORF Transcript_37935/g.60832 Transcript_37935/m.60832 type:complete len:312 (-) Transcript_37935:201-1136(-)